MKYRTLSTLASLQYFNVVGGSIGKGKVKGKDRV